MTGPSLDDRLTDLITRYVLIQHVNEPRHNDGNMLDLILTAKAEANHVIITISMFDLLLRSSFIAV